MVATLQTFVQRRYHGLLMGSLGFGFVLLLVELIGYQHYQGLQLLGTASVVVGAVAAFLGIGAHGNLRRLLAGVFIVLALVGLVGLWAHNADRLGGEEERGPRAGQQGGQEAGGEQPGERARESGGFEPRIPPPVLAPLSLSGLCAIGAIVLLGRREEEM